MKQDKQNPDRIQVIAAAPKPYEPPRILSRERLEAVAANCSFGTGKGNVMQCPSGPLQS